MEDAMTLVGLPALVAGVVAIGATLAIERWGGRIGGLLGSMPTTIVPASLGIWAASPDVSAFSAGMAGVPAGMLVDALFLWCWRVLPTRIEGPSLASTLGRVAAAALTVWFLGATAMVLGFQALAEAGVAPLISGILTLLLLITAGIAACRGAPPSPAGSRRVGLVEVLGRGALAALAIGVCVQIAAAGSPLVAGVASVFPAIFLTTMVSLWWAQGSAVPVGAVGPIMLGSSSVGAYALISVATFPAFGPALGVPTAWLAAVLLTSLPAWTWLQKQSAETP